jgi:Calx-beta domain
MTFRPMWSRTGGRRSPAVSTNGTGGRWGDFNGATAHATYPDTWLGAGHVQNGGATDAFSHPVNFWFMRDRDVQTISVAFAAASSSVGEGASTASPAVRVTTSDAQPLWLQVTVTCSTADGTAKAGRDYTAIGGGSLTFPAGTASGMVQATAIPILNDTLDEANEMFSVALGSPTNAAIASPSAHTVTILDDDQPRTTTVGVYRPSEHVFYLRNSNSSGVNDVPAILYGADGDIPAVGDWGGDGVDTIGVNRPSEHVFYLRNSNTSGPNNVPAILYGAGADIPVVGDWNTDGLVTIGVYRGADGSFYLRNSNSSGVNDIPVIRYGLTGDKPVVGDWDGR